MSDLGNKEVFARNLKFYLVAKGVSQAEVCKTLNFRAPLSAPFEKVTKQAVLA